MALYDEVYMVTLVSATDMIRLSGSLLECGTLVIEEKPGSCIGTTALTLNPYER